MNCTKLIPTMVLLASAATGSSALASPLTPRTPVDAIFGKAHTVSFKLRNDSAQPMKIKAGAQELTLAPGKSTPVKLTIGEQIVVAEQTSQRPAGTVLATVSPALNDTTLAFK